MEVIFCELPEFDPSKKPVERDNITLLAWETVLNSPDENQRSYRYD